MEDNKKNGSMEEKDVVFASVPESENTADVKPDAAEAAALNGNVQEKSKKKNIVFITAACAAAAVVCIGTVGALIAVNSSRNSAASDTSISGPDMSETSDAAGDTSKDTDASSDSDISDGSSASDTSDAASSGDKDVSEGSEQSSKTHESSTKESKAESSAPEVVTFGENVSVDDVDISGMTFTEAHDALQKVVTAKRTPVSITVICDGNKMTLTEDDFVYDSDLSSVLLDAYRMSRGKQNDSENLYTRIDDHLDFILTVTINEDSIVDVIDKIKSHYDIPAVNASVKSFDPKAVEKFTYEDGRDGNVVDRSEIEKNVRKILEEDDMTGSFTLKRKKSKFSVTLADVKANTKLIASHYTTAANVYNSNYNMQLALLSANGTVLQPGEIFSFNKTTGDTTNGNTHYYPDGTVGAYLKSTVIGQGGVYDSDYGGGICQASTTLYNCALKAGLQAVERYPHAYPSIYAARGLDATIDYGFLDMKFKNTLKYPVYIATYVYDYNGDGMNELMVEMYGPLSTEYDEVVPVGWVSSANSYEFFGKGAQVYFKNGKEIKRVFLPVNNSYSYKYDTYYTASSMIPADPENGPVVYPTNTPPTVYSPGGCGSSAPIPYGTAAEYIKKLKEEEQKPKEESSKQESSKQESSKQESSKQESSKQESSKQESSKQESSKQESSKQESSKQESSKQESSKQESSKQESSKQESSKQESSKQESSKQESSKHDSSAEDSTVSETTSDESDE